jgi:regulator of sigma E protease
MQLLEPYLRGGWNILLVVLGLGLIVFLHELGHFLLAKKNKVRVEAFSLGFGPVIWKRRHGETEYRLSVFPLGGYVKMAGESLVDDRRGEPWELTSKTPWQRFQIFVAGATMNLLIAFPIGILAYAVGKVEPTNVVGAPGYAEALAGIRPGDQILQVGDRRIDSLEKMLPEMIRRPNGTVVPVRLKRFENGAEVEKTFEVTVRQSPFHQMQPTTTLVRGLPADGAAYKAGLRDGDMVLAVDGETVVDGRVLMELIRSKPDREVTLKVRRWHADWSTEDPPAITLKIPARTLWRIPSDDHLFEARVGAVLNGTASWKKLEPKDLVTQVKGVPVRSWKEMRKQVESSPVQEIEVRVRREDKGEVATRLVPGVNSQGKGQLGIQPLQSNVVAYVEPESYFDKAGLKAGDTLWAIGLKSGDKSLVIPSAFGEEKPGTGEAPPPVEIKVKRGGEIVALKLNYVKVVEGDLEGMGLASGSKVALSDSQLLRERSFSDAFAAGMREPVDVTVWTFDILRKLITLEESSSGLSGPIGIFHVTFKSVERSFGNYLWLLCLITVNLGIFNLLPIPVLDGGHNVLLLIEVVRKWFGKSPPSEKFVATFQYSGLLFILCLFVMVTFNDIRRLMGGG